MKVLFVCSGNAFRSPVAEALLKKIKPEIEADSAGTNPMIPIAESAESYLTREEAEQHLKRNPESLEEKDIGKYDLVIAMEPRHKEIVLGKCPECSDKIVVWNIADPYFLPQGYAQRIFELIKQRVKELADSL
jgi:protein-tyrosine-phosphatase